MLSEFKKFIMRGNVLDLAIGVIIGAAFGKIVASLVNDILMPVIGLALGKVDFSNLFVTLHAGKTAAEYDTLAKAKADGATLLAYGVFVNTVIEFLIVAFVIFLVVKAANKLQKPAPAAAATTKPCPECTTEIPLAAKRCPACTSVIA
jgi:large conductance mechanosensitive channel